MKPGDQNNRKIRRFNRFKAWWPAWLGFFITALLYEALPKVFYWGPRGLMIGLVSLLILAMIFTHWRSHYRVYHFLALGVNILITLYIIMSVSRIIFAALEGQIGPKHLLISSILLWATNILVFALWYWNLDAGGPRRRETKENLGMSAFLFPQVQIVLSQDSNLPQVLKDWEPSFIDYLFLAFNTTTAFSPTDTPVLTRWAKCMSMLQASISLTIIVMLAARAISILDTNSNYFVS